MNENFYIFKHFSSRKQKKYKKLFKRLKKLTINEKIQWRPFRLVSDIFFYKSFTKNDKAVLIIYPSSIYLY